MFSPNKAATTDHPIHELLAIRYSPYVFDSRPVADHDLKSIFEAARWAPSSYNEQPWRYIVATRDDEGGFNKVLSCPEDSNQAWARHAPVLALAVVSMNFVRNGKRNPAAVHDLGLASMSLSLEATARGLAVHQMIGILPDKARELFRIPDGYEPWTALAIGYAADPSNAPDKLRNRDTAKRQRRKLGEFVFTSDWETPAAFTK